MRCAQLVATAYRLGHRAGHESALKAVRAIQAPYKIAGDHSTYGPYNEGRADFKDAALSAIDSLKEGEPL